MALSAFDDKSAPPTERDLAAVLGRTHALWKKIVAHVATEHPPLTEEWAFSSQKAGWSCRLKQKKRTILYLIPCERHILVAFVLGDRAVAAVRDAGLPAPILALLDAAKRYVEGTGFRFEVRTRADLEAVEKLVAIKMAP